jgi:hypothetical protein
MRGSEIHAGSRRDVGRNVFDISATAQAWPGVGLAEEPRRVSMSDLDPLETREWLDALTSVVVFDGADRTTFLLDELLNGARRSSVPVPYSADTPCLNTIPSVRETPHPGDQEAEAFEGIITDLYLPKRKAK